MEARKSEAVKNWPKPKFMKNIQVFLGFANFYQRFIQDFSKIAISLTSMLQIMKLLKNLLLSIDVVESDEVETVGGGDDCKDETVKKLLCSKNLNRVTGYLTPNARQTFI